MANPAAQAPGCSCCRAPAPQNLWAPRVAPTPHVLPGGGSGGLSGGDAARVCRLRRVLSVCRRCYPQGCAGLARGPRLPLRCPRKQCKCGSCRQGPPGQLGASRLRVSGSLPSPKGQWGPTALPSCPEGRRRLGRGGLGLSWPAWAQGAGPGPLRGTWQANGAGMRCSPRPGPRHSGIWGYACPHHILKRRERRGVWGAPSWQVLAPVPARPPSCPEQNPLWVRAPRPATQRERT